MVYNVTMAMSSVTFQKKLTRKSSEIYGLGQCISVLDATINGSKLPTYNQVIRCYMYYQQYQPGETKHKMAQKVLDQVIPFYMKANVPMIHKEKAYQKIWKAVQNNAKLRAIPSQRRDKPFALEKLKKENLLLHKKFPLWPQNAETVMTNEEDIKFLRSMQTDRVATFGGLDQKQSTKLKKRQHKKKIAISQKEKALQKQMEADEKVELLSSTDESSQSSHGSDLSISETEENFSDRNVQPKCLSTRKHVKTKTGTAGFFHANLLKSNRLTSLAARLNMTPAQQHIYTKALIEETGGDPLKLKISYSYADKSRRKVVENIAVTAKDCWASPSNIGLSLHWDSKQLPSLNNPNILEERLVVVVGTQQDTKLLGTPSYPSRSCGDRPAGRKVADLTIQLIEEWNGSENIVNMVFDTTASNTGHLTAACVCIQEQLGRALLWSGCRHHVGEVVLTHIFKDLNIETSKSPDISVFLKFR